MPTLHLIDGSGYVFRAYHALPALSTSKGVPTHAVRGVASMLLKDLREQKPTHIAVCMDLDAKQKRAEIYPEYKAHRPPPPEDLAVQFKLVKEVIRALNLPMLEQAGYEADDIIATLARQAVAEGFDVVIVTGDKDLMQLVHDGKVKLFDGMKGAWYGEAEVKEKWGVPPRLVGDLLALTGDDVDNIPGVPGVGAKTAAQLLTEYGSLDGVLERMGEVKKPKLRENLLAHRDQIQLARRLVALDDQMELGLTPQDLARKPIELERVRGLFTELEMFSILKDLPKMEGGASAQPAPLPAGESAPVPPPPAPKVEHTIVRDVAALRELATHLQAQPRFGFRLVLTTEHALKDPLVGVAVATAERAVYVPVGLAGLGQQALSEAQVLEALKPVLEAQTPLKDGHGLKTAATWLLTRGVRLAGLGVDAELASFLVNAARREHALADLSRERLGLEIPPAPQDSRKRPALAGAMPEEIAPFAATSAEAARRLAPLLAEDLTKSGIQSVYEDVERPLVPVLAQMEVHGIRVDVDALRTQGTEFEKEIEGQLKAIYAAAGKEFNVNAPAQLGEVLFDTLQLPVIKRGKTGPSTDAEVLEKLAEQHPLPQMVMDYRGLSKLKNTYLDTLPELVDAGGRIHTTYNQLGAATGRLSSNDPNLQNIPIRTEVGKRIRAAFVAAEGCELVSADYSQIELRILAHVSGDKALVESFAKGEDVHTRTASEIYGVTPDLVSGEMRRVAKMINYAIAYGLSSFGLSSRIGIPTDEAKRVIEAYFARYTGVKQWLDETLVKGREQGYVATLIGRRRQLLDLRSKNPSLRMAAERAAVNAPIQGTAADIVKLAMLHVDKALREQMPEARMLLQVHDELVFEVPRAKTGQLVALVRPLMERAVELRVPLVVDVGHGHSWAEAH